MPAPFTITRILPIDYPIIQAPMLGVTTPDMVAAIANAGGLGSLPVGGLSPEKTTDLIRETKAKTNKPFAVNLFTHETTLPVDPAELDAMQDWLAALYAEYGLPFERRGPADFTFYNYRDQVAVLLSEQIPVVSFTFGTLEPAVIDPLKRQGSRLIGTATSVREARLLAELGVDAVVAQGVEAGGHRGSFLTDEALPQVGLMALLPQIAAAVSVPVIAAGGLFDAGTVKAAFGLGAAGVQLGSYFLASDESGASAAYKEAVLGAGDTATALTRAFSGRWARGIRNGFMTRMEQSGLTILPYTYQNSLTAALRTYGQQHNLADLIALWAGQSASQSRRGPCRALLLSLVEALRSGPEPLF